MKIDELYFLTYCYILRTHFDVPVRDIVNMFDGVIHHKRCWYLLKKWSSKGVYSYGVSLDLGWFLPLHIMNEPYRDILTNLTIITIETLKSNIKALKMED